ncbi:unnamed product [Ostreococcus tauri]|uniref:Unnamed product n=1 Tax=Ostreococcus tauri TaxID=70448 RepID=A0A090M7C5_OSTTA|nr:unnamed product [Ostreococcus tauri]CEF97989.1 unnamed product [Ostreococcus tauri]|eukprot:XP_022839014.1 unnamed product [Ostreococcus tauri]
MALDDRRHTPTMPTMTTTPRAEATPARPARAHRRTGPRTRARGDDDARETRLARETKRDNAYTGGFAGGEKALLAYREDLARGNAAEKAKKAAKPRRESREVRLEKDFGGLAGGFPGGEVGLKSYNATGEVPETKAPTLGWGPPALGSLVVLCGYTFVNEGELSVDALRRSATTLVTKLADLASSTPAEETDVDGVAGAFGTAVSLVPEPVKEACTTAALVAFAVLFGTVAIRSAVKKAVRAFGESFRVIALATVSGTIALKILNIL